jgi:hypothetical protein
MKQALVTLGIAVSMVLLLLVVVLIVAAWGPGLSPYR